MKRTLCLLLSTIMAAVLFASNVQRIIPLGDESYEIIDNLFISLGMATPSGSRPWSEDEFMANLRRIDEKTLSVNQSREYEKLARRYGLSDNEDVQSPIQISVAAALEGYAHTNEEFEEARDWLYGAEKRKPLLSASIGLSPIDLVFAELDATIETSKFSSAISETSGRQQWFKQAFATNLFMFNSKQNGSFDGNIPYRAYFSFGGDGWNLELGRERLSWGVGTSGNLIVGDQLEYHNMLRFTSYSDTLKITFLASFFPHPNEIYDKNNKDHTEGTTYSQTSAPTAQGLKAFLGHMLELFLLDGKLYLSISENIMYQSDEANLDLRHFSPMMVFHNFYNPKNMNSILGIETVWAPSKGFNAYIQFALDDMALSTETSNKPNAIGLIGGMKWTSFEDAGLFSITLEGAYTSPYMYLRSKEAKSSQTDSSDTLNFIVAIRRWFGSDGDNIVYDEEYLGYRYGNDAIVGLLDVSYNDLGSFKANAGLFFMIHGQKNKNSAWKMGKDLETNANKTPFGNAEYTFATSVGMQYTFSKTSTTLAAQAAIVKQASKGVDFQLTLSATQIIL